MRVVRVDPASTAAWITITARASGTGTAASYNVAANALTSSRTGTMTIAGQTMTVTQAGAPCTYTISPTVASLGPRIDEHDFSDFHTSGLRINAASEKRHRQLQLPAGRRAPATGTVTYSVTANPTMHRHATRR